MNNNWEKILNSINADLAKSGVCIKIADYYHDGCYTCKICNGGVSEVYAENYFEEELAELITDAHIYILNNILKEKKPTLDKGKELEEETDWWYKYGIYALNRDTQMFENTSYTKNLVMYLYNGVEEDEVSAKLNKWKKVNNREEDFTLYNINRVLVGFVVGK